MEDSQSSQIKWLAAALVMVAVAAFLIWNVVSEEDEAPHSPQPVTPATLEQPRTADSFAPDTQEQETELPVSTEAERPKPTLPSLDQSDTAVKQDINEASSRAAQLLTEEFVIRKAVRAISALAGGELVNQYRPFKDPSTPFAATKTGDKFAIAESNYRRYTPYIEALDQMGSERVEQMYWHYYPLMQEAYAELGMDKREFREVSLTAINQMLNLPDIPEEIALEQPTVMYKFADPALEELPAAQKLMLRLGPENRAKLLPILVDLQQALESR